MDVNTPVGLQPSTSITGEAQASSMEWRCALEMHINAQATSLRYFNIYAVWDKLDMSSLPDDAALPDLSLVRIKDVLPWTLSRHVLVKRIQDRSHVFLEESLMAPSKIKKYHTRNK